MWVLLQVFSVLIKEMVVTGELSRLKKIISKQEKNNACIFISNLMWFVCHHTMVGN